jgi:hypothetical protein
MISGGGNSEIAGIAAASIEHGSAVWMNRARHLVLQAAAAILVVVAANWWLPFTPPQSDALGYLLLARDLKYDGGFLYHTEPETSLHFPPGYPWLLSLLVQRESLGLAPLVQRLYQGITISVGAIWATTAYGVGVGWLVFALLAINPALVSSSDMLASEAPHTPLYLLGFLAWFRFVKNRGIVLLIMSGLCFALAAYLRVYGMLLVVFIPILILVGMRNFPWRARLGYVAMYMLCWVIILSPWTVRNYQLFGHVVPMTIKTGHGLYSAWFPPKPKQFGMMAQDAVVEQARKIQDPFERNLFYERAAVRKILSDPVTTLQTVVRKLAFYVMPFDWEFFGKYNDQGRLRPSLHFVYVFLLPFAAVYVWQNRRDEVFWLGYMAPILFGLMITVLVYGIPRFRLCIEPFLTVFAAVYLVQWISANPRWRGAVAGSYFLACLAGAYGFVQLVR